MSVCPRERLLSLGKDLCLSHILDASSSIQHTAGICQCIFITSY